MRLMKDLSCKIQVLLVYSLLIIIWPSRMIAQDGQTTFEEELLNLEIVEKIVSYNDQLKELQLSVSECTAEELTTINKHLTAIDLKWNMYYQSRQAEIANNDSLLQLVTDYEFVKQEIKDSIDFKNHYFEAEKTLKDSEILIFSQDSSYANFYKEALGLSMTKQTAPLLEKLKIKEQLQFTELETHYEQSKALAQEFPKFNERFTALEDKFIELKDSSAKIQALEYKPFFARIKDYLFGLAAVSMILMFINVIQAKIKQWKQVRKNMKKIHDLTHPDDDYPCI